MPRFLLDPLTVVSITDVDLRVAQHTELRERGSSGQPRERAWQQLGRSRGTLYTIHQAIDANASSRRPDVLLA